MKRTLRTPDELFEIFDNAPTLGALYYSLAGIENITVQPDGTGESVFKVYLTGRLGKFEAFLWVNRKLDKSYIQWLHQAELADRCRELWGDVVKNRDNPDGSELQSGIDTDSIIRIAKRYAAVGAA